MGIFDELKDAFMEGFTGEEKKNLKESSGIAVVKSVQVWSIFGNRKNVIQLLENICSIVSEQEKIKYKFKVAGYIEKQAQMYPSATQLADVSIQLGQFVSLSDRFDEIGIQNSYSILNATFDQETGSDEWSRGEITFPIYDILNKSGNENFNVMAPFEKVIGRWQNIIINNIDSDENVILGNRQTSISIVGLNSSLQNFLNNKLINGIFPSFKNAEFVDFSDDENVFNVAIYIPTEIHTLLESIVRGKKSLMQKFFAVHFDFDMNNEINGLSRILFEFNVTTLALDEDDDIIDIAEDCQDIGNAISNELMKYI